MEQVVEIPTSAWPTGIAWISGNLQEACLQRFFTSVGTLARRTTAPSRHLLLRRYSNVLLSETSCSGKCASSVSRPGPAITALFGAKNRELASGGKFEHCRGWFMHSHRPCNLLAAAGRMPVPHGTSPRPVFFWSEFFLFSLTYGLHRRGKKFINGTRVPNVNRREDARHSVRRCG